MNVFNSLGSNYNFALVLKALFSASISAYATQLTTYLETRYRGKAVLVYKGREALELALKMLNFQNGTKVAINGFTCYAVYKAIINTGNSVEFLDIDPGDVNFSAKTLAQKLGNNPTIKAVIIQNTLGYPCDIAAIVKICKERHIILIEDLAHSIGTTYKNNQEAGTVGDFVVLSFSQDKMIDGVSGGALIVRNKQYQKAAGEYILQEIPKKQQVIDRLYPLFTTTIRATYPFMVGKIIHTLFKKLNVLSNPMGNDQSGLLHRLPGWYCNVILEQWKNLQKDITHRREIAKRYCQILNAKLVSTNISQHISESTNLRFPIFVPMRETLIQYLLTSGVYVSDIWYDAPIAPKRYLARTNYRNQCKESENVSMHILNLPTHRNVTLGQAGEIAERINQWLALA